MSVDLEALRPRTGMWAAVGVFSLALHGALAAGLNAYEPPPEKPVRIPVEVRIAEPPPPEPPPPPPPEPEPVPEPPPPPPEPEVPREAVVQDDPPPPPKKKPRRKKPKKVAEEPPKPAPTPPPADPKPDAPTEPPPLMGLELEGLAMSNTGGIAVNQGTSSGARDGAADGTGKKGPRKPVPDEGQGDAEETVPIAGVTSLPVLIREVKPDFPDELKRKGIEGKVVLSLVVGSDGRVKKARVVSKLHPELDKLARRAARKLKFRPATVRGTPVAVNLSYTFYFVID